jgi:hypothetical protein
MSSEINIIERALQIAREGACLNWNEVAKKLKSEGHGSVEAHLSGPSLRKQINALCEANRIR